MNGLNQVGHVHGHLVNPGVVELLNVVQRALVLLSDKVDGDSLTAESSASTDPAIRQQTVNNSSTKQTLNRLWFYLWM